MNIQTVNIIPFTYRHSHLFAKLRREIDAEADYVLAKKGERKENAIHVIGKLLLSQRRTVTFLAFDGKECIGYVSLVFPKFAKLQGNSYLTIGLREKYQGKGIGSLLMEKAEGYAKSRNVRRVELEVFGSNTRAIRLYTKRNYLVEGIKKEAIVIEKHFDDIIIMVKHLQSLVITFFISSSYHILLLVESFDVL